MSEIPTDEYPQAVDKDDPLDAPAGSWALPVDEDGEGDWLDAVDDPEARAQMNREKALCMAWFGKLAGPDYDGEALPEVSPQDVADWYSNLPADKQAMLAEEKDYRRGIEATTKATLENLQATAPSLLEGRLPETQESKLNGLEYALGVRQVALDTAGDAQRDVYVRGGVSSAGQNLSQSFNIVSPEDPDYATGVMVKGYYGAGKGGKYVVVLPAEAGSSGVRGRAIQANEALLDTELVRTNVREGWVIDQKYCAGFIDNSGVYFPNRTFMQGGVTAADFGVEQAEQDQSWL